LPAPGLVDRTSAGRSAGALLSRVAIGIHIEQRKEGGRVKRGTKKLIIGAVAGLALYHFVIAPNR
jgi:hypothetical protein